VVYVCDKRCYRQEDLGVRAASDKNTRPILTKAKRTVSMAQEIRSLPLRVPEFKTSISLSKKKRYLFGIPQPVSHSLSS
jgi:hypothetical protein